MIQVTVEMRTLALDARIQNALGGAVDRARKPSIILANCMTPLAFVMFI